MTGLLRKRAFHLLKVKQLDRITDDAVAITFDVPDELSDEFAYAAGQHVAVRATVAGDDVRRTYSICAPAGSGVLRIGVKRLPGGVFSGYALERLQVGDTIEVMSPSGTFTPAIDPARAVHYGAIVAGSGITPVLSILTTALQLEPQSTASLIFVNASTSSIMFLEEVEDLKNRFLGRFEVFHVLDKERRDTDLLSGRLDAERLTGLLEVIDGGGGVDAWYLCGPLPLTEMARETLVGRGVPDEHIHRELFHTGDGPAPQSRLAATGAAEGTSQVTVRLDGRTTSFELAPASESILDATRALRPEVPYACKNGVCGTCRCRLVDGTVEMVQNFALEPDEVASGYVLACQSYPTSSEVTMDFDQ